MPRKSARCEGDARAAFGSSSITSDRIGAALARFVRAIVTVYGPAMSGSVVVGRGRRRTLDADGR